MDNNDLKLNSRWYVKLQNATTLVEREIIEVTALTVLLKDVDNPYSNSNISRYQISDIEFIEVC